MRAYIEILVLISVILALSFLALISGAYVIPGESIRGLAAFYLSTTFNATYPYTANSPEAVTAIVWDYRGLDTLYETAVFYLALMAGLALARGLPLKVHRTSNPGLSVIVKTAARLTAPMILAVGISIGLHGHLTPGGGFQGGATVAVIPLTMIVAFSLAFMAERGVSREKLLALRSAGLVGIGVTSIAVFLLGLIEGVNAYVFQSMPKPGSPIGMPAEMFGALTSGVLWFFNLFELAAVAAGFSLAFVILLAPGGGGK
ncbi:MAG: MnhB domain-containing protein [Desulfurococcaceae archaeon]